MSEDPKDNHTIQALLNAQTLFNVGVYSRAIYAQRCLEILKCSKDYPELALVLENRNHDQ